MKVGLIVLGIILLVVGGVLYLYPSQTFSTQTNSAPNGESNVRNSSAILNIPIEWSYGLMIMGALFLVFGLVAPSPVQVISGQPGPRGHRGSPGKVTQRRVRGKSRAVALPSGTSVTTTTRIQRKK